MPTYPLEVTPLTPRHVCRLVLPSSGPSPGKTSSYESNSTISSNSNSISSRPSSHLPSTSTISSIQRAHESTNSLSSYTSAHTKTTIGTSNLTENALPLRKVNSNVSYPSCSTGGTCVSSRNSQGKAPVVLGCNNSKIYLPAELVCVNSK